MYQWIMGVITILIPLFSQNGIKLSCTGNTCLQDQQSVFTDLHTLNSPWWGVHVSESQCRRHSWLGCLLLGGTHEAIKVCDCFARLQSPRFVSWSIYKSDQLKLHFGIYVPYMLLLLSALINEQWLQWTIQLFCSFCVILEWELVRFIPTNE
jgi:hypothetical protein